MLLCHIKQYFKRQFGFFLQSFLEESQLHVSITSFFDSQILISKYFWRVYKSYCKARFISAALHMPDEKKQAHEQEASPVNGSLTGLLGTQPLELLG